MLNAEKFKDEIEMLTYKFGLVNNKIVGCNGVICDDCGFGFHQNNLRGCGSYPGCNQLKFEWLLSEYKPAVTLTSYQKELLTHLYFELEMRYIARGKATDLLIAYKDKPTLNQSYDIWENFNNEDADVDAIAVPKPFDTFYFIKPTDTEPWEIWKLLEETGGAE